MGVDKKVEKLNKSMMQYVNVLNFHHVVRGTKKLESTRKPLFIVRYRNEEEFIGRQGIMEEIAKGFKLRTQIIAISGIGEVG